MKLAGLRVIDLSVFLPGPYLTKTLADHGAEVIKVEAPGGGDPSRHIGESDGPTSVFFRNVNRGKKSAVIDLKSEAGRNRLLDLSETADVFIESFRPGVVGRLGIDYETVSARNLRIVYCSISAFGQDGPYRDRPAHALAVEALSGMLSITVGEDNRPAIPGIAIADIVSSLQGLSGVLMALLRRETTGRGDYIDISMHESMLAAGPNVLGPVFAENRQPAPKNERTTGGSAFYRIYETKDGRFIVLGGQEIKFVRSFLSALGRLDLLPLCERGPGPHQLPLIAFLQDTFSLKTLEEWVIWLKPLDVCFAPVKTLPEAFDDEHVCARGTIQLDELGRKHIGPVIRFRHEPAYLNLNEPLLGEHTATFIESPAVCDEN